jgi:hypothetical protein
MNKMRLILTAAVAATFFIFDAAVPTPASARWWDYPHSGYCTPGTCTRLGGWRALNIRNCLPRPNCPQTR